jgi:hypothetical protein
MSEPSLAGIYVLMFCAALSDESKSMDCDLGRNWIAGMWDTFDRSSRENGAAEQQLDWPNFQTVLTLGQLHSAGCITDPKFHRERPMGGSDDPIDALGVRFTLTEKGKRIGIRCQEALAVNLEADLKAVADLPEDYEPCGDCGYDHDYEYEQAHSWHTKNHGSYS